MFQTGLVQDRLFFREAIYQPNMSGETPDSYFQKVAFIRNQGGRPSCVGQAVSSCIDADLLDQYSKEWPSAISLWRYARFLQDNLENVLVGTRAEYAFETLKQRGWDKFVVGEDFNLTSDNLRQKDKIEDELYAYDNRLGTDCHWRITAYRPGRTAEVISALLEEKRVVFGAGVTADYMTLKKGQVATPNMLGDRGDGHLQRIFGFVKQEDRILFAVQNSWGEAWGGILAAGEKIAHRIEGDFPAASLANQAGCAMVEQECVENAWDIHVFTTRAK